MCTASGIAPPVFEEITGAAVVTFRVPVAMPGTQPESGAESRADSLARRILEALRTGEQPKGGLAKQPGLSSVAGQLNRAVAALVEGGLVEHTIPDKPNSRLQKFRLTPAGRTVVARRRGG